MEEPRLSTDDLRLLGNFYSNGFSLVIVDNGNNVRLVPPESKWFPLLTMTGIISAFYAVFLYFAVTLDIAAQLGPAIWIVYAAIGLIAIAGPVVGHLLRLRSLQRNSPQLDFDRRNGTLSVLANRETFESKSVHCLLGLSMRDSHGDANSELQIIVRDANGFRPILITTDLSSFARRSFGDTLARFQSLTGLQAVIAEPKGLLKGGPIRIEYLDAEA
ncbi:hypothetical protein [Rhodopirellula baltica]|uniref:Uncharacterized protein n=1 Tax=Rhodopirellula baltica SWK14 TaxID=993516 RepID=L7CEX1_RHOBT|nr:hypothetical protein [Rhodopirellula baltica]ELP32390.1 hypothetical protein RBSWK_03694 [Rhodopirellula baltica SWK14]